MKAQIWNFNEWIPETEPGVLFPTFYHMLDRAGFNVIDWLEHHFDPIGYTALFLLGESHFAIHTFPEENKTYIELSSCNKAYFDKFVSMLHGG